MSGVVVNAVRSPISEISWIRIHTEDDKNGINVAFLSM